MNLRMGKDGKNELGTTAAERTTITRAADLMTFAGYLPGSSKYTDVAKTLREFVANQEAADAAPAEPAQGEVADAEGAT